MATNKRFVAKNGLDNNNQSIINVADPQSDQDVATKKSVDTTVAVETTARINAVNTVQASINAEATARANADTTLQNNINAESSARAAAVSSLQSEIATVSSSISALGSAFNYVGTLNGGASAEAAYDMSTLAAGQKDAGDYFKVAQAGYFKVGTGAAFYANINDGLVWNTLGAVDVIDNTNTAVSGTSNFIAVTGSTDSGFVVDVDNTFKTRVTNVEADVLVEKTARINADNTLQGNINAEATTRANADTALTNSLNSEITSRTNADTILQNNINVEATSRSNADTTLQSNISTVSGNLNTEITARTNADATITNNLNAEVTARTDADSTLQSNINTVAGNLNTEVTARSNADATLQSNINNVANSLENEKTARANADTTLQNNINAEITARTNADTTLQNNINAKQDAATAITTSNIGSQSVASAGKLTTARTVALAGDVTGSVSFDGSVDATITTSVAAGTGLTQEASGLALTAITAGDATVGALRYNGTTATAGQFDGGTTTPTGTTRLNYGGYFYPTFINLAGSADTTTAATHYMVETGSDGFVRPKTLANVQSEVVTTAAVSSAALTSGSASTGVVKYNGTTATAGQFDGGTTTPSGTTRLNYGGYLYATEMHAGNFNSTSDLRLKSNVETLSNASDVLMSLRPVSYTLNSTGKKSYGVIAQEIENVLPELVNTDEEGMKSVSYTPLIAFLIETVQSLQKTIADVKARLDTLESK